MTKPNESGFIEKLKETQAKDEKNRKHQGQGHPEKGLPNEKR